MTLGLAPIPQLLHPLLHPLVSLEWRECKRMPVGMSAAQAVVLNGIGKVYVGGGTSYSSFASAFICVYKFMSDSWKRLATPTFWFALTTYHGQLVLAGGRDVSTRTVTNQLWVPLEEGQIWTQPLPPMPTKRYGASAVGVGDHLIVAGGVNENCYLSRIVEVYDGHQWAEAESLPIACNVMKSIVHEGDWYLLGGYGQEKEVFCASLDSLIASTHSGRTGTSVWKRLPEVPLEYSSAAIFGNCLIAAAGGHPSTSTIHTYSPSTQSWVHVGNIPIACNSTCTVVLPIGEILVVGGLTRLNNLSARVFRGCIKVTRFPDGYFSMSAIARLAVAAGIDILRELVPRYWEVMTAAYIQQDHAFTQKLQSTHQRNLIDCINVVLEEWLAGESPLPPTWKQLLGVLRTVNMEDPADRIEHFFMTTPVELAVVVDPAWEVAVLHQTLTERVEQLHQCEETIQMLKEEKQETLQQVESLEAENQRLRKQQEYEVTGYLRGVDVIGETSLLVTREAQTYHWAGYGLKVHVPPRSLPAGVEECKVDAKVGLTGQFEFPEGCELVSAVYWLYSPLKFSQPLTVEVQHCAKESEDSSLGFVIAKCSQDELPYKFKTLQRGVFAPHSSHGSISLSHFSLVGVTQRGGNQQYCARLFYLGSRIDRRVHFVITKDLKACKTVVNRQYSMVSAIEGPSQRVEFEADRISLEVPVEGARIVEGWNITPLMHPTILKRHVDGFERGQLIPQCQLRVKWTKADKPPVELCHRVKLQGAKEPFNFTTIESDPLPQATGTAREVTGRKRQHKLTAAGQSKRARHEGGAELETGEGSSGADERRSLTALASKYPGGVESEPQLSDLMNDVAAHIPSRWREVGIQIGLNSDQLDGIAVAAPSNPLQCFSSVFTFWRKRMTAPYKWSTVIQALQAPAVAELKLANELKKKLARPSPP